LWWRVPSTLWRMKSVWTLPLKGWSMDPEYFFPCQKIRFLRNRHGVAGTKAITNAFVAT
jgi:hypothetical protein